ncbi:glycoside hydrolase family 51 protein [Mrakia frigida]|uniref:glycoside hydrolase family 51 protein n=1 Tax=Mrakia frigida TaxID=29902 RepID=UPI003FCC1BD9
MRPFNLIATTTATLALLADASPLIRRADDTVSLTISKEGGFESLLRHGADGGYGFMFEDINNSGDGGIYAELLQNRAFQIVDVAKQTTALVPWASINGTAISVVNDTAGISSALPNSLKVEVVDGVASFENPGFWGIKIDCNWTYKASFYAKLASSFTSDLTVSLSLISNTTGTVFATQDFTGITDEWKQFDTKLTPSSSAEDLNNTFVVQVNGGEGESGEVLFGLFSLFPPTYKDRENGMRIDLAEVIADVKPSVWRFPGGNNLEGQTIETRWKWNETIGPLSERPGRMGDWSYINTDGLGLMEYLLWVEDLNVTGIMGVYAGYSLERHTVPEADLAPFVEEALGQIEFTLGDVSTPYGALRAAYGHPEPFTNIKYIEIGNEDFFEPDSYAAYRWAAYESAISAAWPDLKLIATTQPVTVLDPPEEYSDRHVYETPDWFAANAHRYDNESRPGPLIFEGEYASTSMNESALYGTVAEGRLRYSTLQAATGEAAYMTMLERNSDIVFAASYAPMLENINRFQWTPNLILFDAGSVYPSASYYVQKIFSTHRGDTILPVTTSALPTNFTYVASSTDTNVFLKTSNYSPSPVSLSISLDGFNATSAVYEYITASDLMAANIPGQEILVDIKGPVDASMEGGAVAVELPAWSVAVVTVEV